MHRSNKYRIRPAREEDRDRFLSMWTDFLSEQTELDKRLVVSSDARERLDNDFGEWISSSVHGLFVAESEREGLVGFASVELWYPAPIYASELEAFLEELYVAPAWRGQGIAKALLADVRAWAEAREASRIRLGVLHANTTGRAFWEGLGANSFAITMLIEL